MKQGIDFSVEYEISLYRPKKLWGANKINEKTGMYKIGYRLIIENYYLSNSLTDYKDEKHFFSLAKLH